MKMSDEELTIELKELHEIACGVESGTITLYAIRKKIGDIKLATHNILKDKDLVIVEQTKMLKEFCIEKCRVCDDYNLCCEIGRCGNYNKGCYNHK